MQLSSSVLGMTPKNKCIKDELEEFKKKKKLQRRSKRETSTHLQYTFRYTSANKSSDVFHLLNIPQSQTYQSLKQ